MRCRNCGALTLTPDVKCRVCGAGFRTRFVMGRDALEERMRRQVRDMPDEQVAQYARLAQERGVPLRVPRSKKKAATPPPKREGRVVNMRKVFER